MQLQLGVDLNIVYAHLSEEELMSKIMQARKKLCHAQSQAAELRDKMLEEIARDCTTHVNLDTATIIKNKWHREECSMCKDTICTQTSINLWEEEN
eukprot:9679831-Ditylum_brightwellii.AAC.1